MVMWQIPLGNTRMRAENNTWDHYQDNRPNGCSTSPPGLTSAAYRERASSRSCSAAAPMALRLRRANDGVTNPAAINGNTIASELAAAGSAPAQVTRGTTPTLVSPTAADDDGGFFRWKAWQSYQTGVIGSFQLSTPGAADQPANHPVEGIICRRCRDFRLASE